MGGRAVPSCSDGAVQEQDETEDRCGSGGEDRFGGAAGAGDGGRLGAALPGTSQSDIRVEEAASEQAAWLRSRPYGGGEQVQKAFTAIAPPAAEATAVADANRQGGPPPLREVEFRLHTGSPGAATTDSK